MPVSCASIYGSSSVFRFTPNIIFRQKKEEDPGAWSNIKFEYSANTSTTSLRPHIERHHLQLFQEKARQHGWKILLPGLVSQARSAASAAESAQGERPDRFNEETFHRCLFNFIVADDQVFFLCLLVSQQTHYFKSLNVIECPEFRVLLLLLRNDLKESMIPHRTKLRELIVEAWRRYFQQLKLELSVPPPP